MIFPKPRKKNHVGESDSFGERSEDNVVHCHYSIVGCSFHLSSLFVSSIHSLTFIGITQIFNKMFHFLTMVCIPQGSASLLLQTLEKEKELLRIFLKVSQMENTLLRRMNLHSFLMVMIILSKGIHIVDLLKIKLIKELMNVQLSTLLLFHDTVVPLDSNII